MIEPRDPQPAPPSDPLARDHWVALREGAEERVTQQLRAAGRVLRPGGRLCIVPLYLAEEYRIQSDQTVVSLLLSKPH